MKQAKGRKKQSVPKKQSINKKDQKAVIYLDPEKLKYPERVNAAKLKIVKECAKMGDLRKLDELKRYDEDEIITAEYNQNDLDDAYYAGFEDAYELAQREGLSATGRRVEKSSIKKKAIRVRKEQYIIECYIKMVNSEKEVLKHLSENKMAQRIKERVETVLISARLDGKPVLTSKVDRNGKIKYSGHSTKTIIDILSNSDKISFYPWRKTLPERNVFPKVSKT